MPRATTMIQGLVAGLLVLATLVMFAGSGPARTFVQADPIQPLETVITDTVLTGAWVPAADEFAIECRSTLLTEFGPPFS